ncbi:hypothetical protein DPMN_110654 [Dreissena polymorpha]|uniref:Uncharacterized protein n=1 Tax=Dreissena polymorpha TaxID=45954 RepID=A0A9D4QP58_DREPO|nr:hypothetical protein DPMN_110654 [Dreissena polymorpha]
MFGNDDFKILVKQFEKHLLTSAECLNEYRQYKNLVSGSYKTETLEAITRTIITKYHDEFPNITIFLRCCTVIRMNSVKRLLNTKQDCDKTPNQDEQQNS